MSLRPTVQLQIVTGLKHVLAIVMALVLFGVGIAMIWVNIRNLTMPVMLGSSVALGIGLLIAIPTDIKQAIDYATEKAQKFKKSTPEGGA